MSKQQVLNWGADFPPSRSLPQLLSSQDWTWHPFPGKCNFRIGEDIQGKRWLVKFRGGFNAIRERAFSIIAQALDISCQSSTFLTVPKDCSPVEGDFHQLAIVFLDEHEKSPCGHDCPITNLEEQLSLYKVEVLRSSPVAHAIDIARGEMLGYLCNMHEPPGHLVTRCHRLVQMDNELMFCQHGTDLWDSSWVCSDGFVKPSGLEEARRLCEGVLSLPDEVFLEAVQLPQDYRPQEIWNVQKEIETIQPRASFFLKTLPDKLKRIRSSAA